MSDESDRSDKSDARQNRPCASPPAVRRNKHYLACRAGGATKGTNASHPGIRSDIAPLSGGFAEEQRQERTCVRDWSGDDCKASGSKQDRSVNSLPS